MQWQSVPRGAGIQREHLRKFSAATLQQQFTQFHTEKLDYKKHTPN
jgi:hypothetical protein